MDDLVQNCVHSPDVWHAGDDSGQSSGCSFVDEKFPWHATHCAVCVLQTGVVDAGSQSALLAHASATRTAVNGTANPRAPARTARVAKPMTLFLRGYFAGVAGPAGSTM
jgi:hypothetical protein